MRRRSCSRRGMSRPPPAGWWRRASRIDQVAAAGIAESSWWLCWPLNRGLAASAPSGAAAAARRRSCRQREPGTWRRSLGSWARPSPGRDAAAGSRRWGFLSCSNGVRRPPPGAARSGPACGTACPSSRPRARCACARAGRRGRGAGRPRARDGPPWPPGVCRRPRRRRALARPDAASGTALVDRNRSASWPSSCGPRFVSTSARRPCGPVRRAHPGSLPLQGRLLVRQSGAERAVFNPGRCARAPWLAHRSCSERRRAATAEPRAAGRMAPRTERPRRWEAAGPRAGRLTSFRRRRNSRRSVDDLDAVGDDVSVDLPLPIAAAEPPVDGQDRAGLPRGGLLASRPNTLIGMS